MARLIITLLVLGSLSIVHPQKPSISDKINNIFGDLKVETKNPNVTHSNVTQPNVTHPSVTHPSVTHPNATSSPLEDCECVSYYLCKDDSSIDTSGAGIIDIRADECGHYLKRCCTLPNISKAPIKPPAPTIRVGCGLRNTKGYGIRIVGDVNNETQFGEFPWMAALTEEKTIEGKKEKLLIYQCGASIIHKQALITAAHCVADKSKTYIVRAGDWDTQTTDEVLPHQSRLVKSITIHPKFRPDSVFNDVAVLILEHPFDLDDHIDLVCLPPQGEVTPHGTRCFATGWGKDVFGKEGVYQVILKKVEVPVVKRDVCQDNLRKTRLSKFFELHESFMCAGGEAGKDTCKGDGGSPLVCPIEGKEGRYQQAGIVSWGISCGQENVPGVYADVAKFTDWITEQLKLNNLDAAAAN